MGVGVGDGGSGSSKVLKLEGGIEGAGKIAYQLVCLGDD